MPDMEHEQCSKSDIDMITGSPPTAAVSRGHRSELPMSPKRSSRRSPLHRLLEYARELRPAAACRAPTKELCSRPHPERTSRAHVSQHMEGAHKGVEAGWRPHTSNLEGRHDVWKPSGVLPSHLGAALPLRRSSPAPNVKDIELATRLQLARVELCAPNFTGARTHMPSVRP